MRTVTTSQMSKLLKLFSAKTLTQVCAVIFSINLVGGIFLYFSHQNEKEYINQKIVDSKLDLMTKIEYSIAEDINRVKSDTSYLAHSVLLQNYVAGNESMKTLIEEDWGAFLLSTRIYDKIRFIDASGMEHIRVNYEDGTVTTVADQELQDKSHRYYFDETMSLSNGEVFISPADLNMEYGEVELPYKPVIRFGTPIYSDGGTLHGIIIVNFLAQRVLNNLLKSNYQLINSRGIWMHGIEESLLWGGSGSFGVHTENPTLWEAMTTSNESTHRIGNELRVSHRFSPHEGKDTSWYVMTSISDSYLATYLTETIKTHLAYAASLFFVSLTLGGFILFMDYKATRKNHQEALKVESMRATIGAICHEMNQPLTVIKGYTSILKLQINDEGMHKKYVRAIEESSEKACEIMQRIRSVTKYKTVSYSDNTQIVDISHSNENSDEVEPHSMKEPAMYI